MQLDNKEFYNKNGLSGTPQLRDHKATCRTNTYNKQNLPLTRKSTADGESPTWVPNYRES